jgi:transposase
MASIPVELPDNLPACHAVILRQAEVIESLTAQVEELFANTERLDRDLAVLKRQLFGSRRERFEASVPEQLEAQDAGLEASGTEDGLVEDPATSSEPDAGKSSPTATTSTNRRTSKGRQKRTINESIPREKILHRLQEQDVPPELWNNPLAKRFFRFVGEEVELQEARLRVLEHYEEVIALEDDTTGESRMQAASAPEPLIERCYAGEGLLAYLAASRFADHIPYYREEDILARVGFSIHRATSGGGCGSWRASCFRCTSGCENE